MYVLIKRWNIQKDYTDKGKAILEEGMKIADNIYDKIETSL